MYFCILQKTFPLSLPMYRPLNFEKRLLIGLLGFLWSACQTQPSAEQIIDQAIKTHGGGPLQEATVSFDFRKKHYRVQLNHGSFRYESTVNDSIGLVHDVLTNDDFIRTVDGQRQVLNAEDESRYRNALNSVVYFALLPYFLNDPAARKELIGEATVQGKPYYKIRVTFAEEGGGDDYDDEFVYWIHQQHHTMDYLAYSFHVNEGGTRFRQAYHIRNIKGIRFADYINYDTTKGALKDYDRLLEEGKLEELSRIELKNVKVKLG